MTAKTPTLNFQPTPRPRPLNAPNTAAALKELTLDVGFGRPTSAPLPQEAPSSPAFKTEHDEKPIAPAKLNPASALEAPTSRSETSKQPTKAKASATPSLPEGARRSPSLRIEVNDQLWDALRITAMKRRVTVKYIIYEALAAQGFEIDMAAIPEDGRRER